MGKCIKRESYGYLSFSENWSVMLNLFIYATFVSTGLILTGELLYNIRGDYRLTSSIIQSIGAMCLVFLLPVLYLFISNDEGYNKAKWGARRIVFHSLSWMFYLLCVSVSICIGLGWWKLISQQSIGSGTLVVGFLALTSSVFCISSLHEVEAANVLKSFSARLHSVQLFFTMKAMLTAVASALAVLAEITLVSRKNKQLAVIEALMSAALFVIIIFNTHGLGGRLLHNGSDCNLDKREGDVPNSPWAFFQPFVGGLKFIILQVASWLFFALSLLFGLLFILSTFTIGMEIFLGVEAIAGLCCIISEILMIISIYAFKGEEGSILITKAATKLNGEEEQPRSLKNTLNATVQHLHALVVTVLVANMQHLPFIGIVPVFFTAGISVRDTLTHWFTACVSIGIYTLAFAFFRARQFNKRRPMSEADYPINGNRIKTDEPLDEVSVLRGEVTGAEGPNADENIAAVDLSGPKEISYTLRRRILEKVSEVPEVSSHCDNVEKTTSSGPNIEVGDDFSAKYNVVLFIVACVPLAITVYMGYKGSSAFGPWIVVAVCHLLYVGLTYRGAPEITGCREIQEVRKNGPVIRYIGETVRRYFNGSIIKESELDPKGLYVFGFHPHGIVPITLFWLRCSSKWEELFPDVAFSPLTATVLHLVPLMRDLLQWMGGREVSRESFRHALRRGRSCLVVPGGQAEMLQSQSEVDEIKVVTKHSGFIRMALQEGAHLVPILSFGEVDIMDNLRYPVLQQWFLKTIGVAFPHQPYGLFYLPIPRPLKVTVIVGAPIPIVQCAAPSEALVKETMDVYMHALLAMFDRHKVAAGERPERRLVLIESDGKPYKFKDVDAIK